ncbi:hypothetical protein D3C76_705840 [compost metagenome]
MGIEFDDGVGVLGLGHGLVNELRRRHVGLVHFHEVDVDEKRLVRFGRRVEKLEGSFFDIVIKERNADHAGFAVYDRRVHVLAIDLEFLDRFFPRLAGQCALGDPLEHLAGFRIHVREPGGICVGVGVEVVQADVFHHVVTLGIGQRIIGFAQVPFAGEVGVVAAGFQHRCQCPLGGWQAAALALEGHGGHAATIGDTPGLHGRPTRCAAGLGIKGVEGDPFCRQLIDAGRGHASTDPTAVGAQVAIAGIVGDDKQDIGLFRLGCVGKPGQ